MRKDLRVGLGIGGVLLAVMIVALVVRSHNKQNQVARADPNQNVEAPVDPTAPAVPSTPEAGIDVPPAPPAVDVPTPPRPVVDPVFGDPAVPGGTVADAGHAPAAPARATNWDVLLATGVMPTGTTTAPPARLPNPPHHVNGAGGASPIPNTLGNGLLDSNTPPVVTRTNATTGGAAPRTVRPAAAGKTYTVKDGDTMSSISRYIYGSNRHYLQIAKANPTVNPGRMKIGTVLTLPELTASDVVPATATVSAAHTNGPADLTTSRSPADPVALDSKRQYRVQSGDSLSRISQRLYGTAGKIDAIYEANRSAIGPNREHLKLGMLLKLPEPPTIASR